MLNPSTDTLKNIKRIIIIIFFVLNINTWFFIPDTFANNRGYITSRTASETENKAIVSESDYSLAYQPTEENLSELQKQARLYRNQGLELQRIGDLDGAMSLYQKAIELDPYYAVVYNDLGIVFEAKGFIERAEESYLKAINVDSYYLSAYSNLALLYEFKRDLEKAAYYWRKRAELGSIDDPWTKEAEQRLEDIRLVLGQKSAKSKEQEIIDLTRDITVQKSILRKDNKALAKAYLEKAKLSYKRGDEVAALKQAIDASQLNPSDREIEEFIEKIRTRLLSK